jgi:hypothetical protein
MDNAHERIQHIIDRVNIKTRSAVDNDLKILRSMYQSKNEREKQRVREWVNDAAKLATTGVALNPRAVLILEFVEPDENGDDLAVSISATAAKSAIESWDRGEDYSPSLTEFCGEDRLYSRGGWHNR